MYGNNTLTPYPNLNFEGWDVFDQAPGEQLGLKGLELGYLLGHAADLLGVSFGHDGKLFY